MKRGFPGYCCSQWGFCGLGAVYCSPSQGCIRDCSPSSTNTPVITAPPTISTAPPIITTAPPVITTTPPTITTAPPLITTPPPPPTITTAPPAITTVPPTVTTAPPIITTAPPIITTAPPGITTEPPIITTAPPAIQVGLGRRVVYIDYQDINWSHPGQTIVQAVTGGYNVINIAFWMATGAADMAVAWQGLSMADQLAVMATVHAAGAIVMVSAGGSTEAPFATITGSNYGRAVATWVVQNNLDGVDFDMENLGPGLVYNGVSVITWLSDASNAAKSYMVSHGRANGFVSHAPQAPYFGAIGSSVANPWTLTGGGYSAVYAQAPNSIDWFNVQFYNQGVSCYITCTSLFVNSGNGCPYFTGTSVAEIASYGVPLSKIVVGKYTTLADASNGYMTPSALADCFLQATQNTGWKAGVMVWAWQQATSPAWIAQAWPFGGSATSTPPVTTRIPSTAIPSSSPAPTTPAGSAPPGICLTGAQCCVSVGCATSGYPGYCCSQWGYCGVTAGYCSLVQGCQRDCTMA